MPGKKFFKHMLRVGRYFSPDRQVDVTPDKLKALQANFDRMTKAGYVVPIHWDHGTAAESTPMSVDEFRNKRTAKNTVGVLSDFRLNDEGDAAIVTVDLRRPEAVAAAEANDVQLSPVIFDEWSDGKANKYKDAITTVDLVNHPVDPDQTDFSPVADLVTPAEKAVAPYVDQATGMVACAIRLGLDAGKPQTFFFAKKDDEEDDDEDDIDIDLDIDADDDDGDEGDDDDSGEVEDFGGEGDVMDDDIGGEDVDVDLDFDPDSLEFEPGPEDTGGMVGEGEDAAELEALEAEARQDLEGIGIVPPTVSLAKEPFEFIKQLCAAMKQRKADEAEDTEDLGLPGEEEEVTATAPDFAALSLQVDESQKQLGEAKKKIDSQNQEIDSLKTQAAGAIAFALDMHRNSALERLEAVFNTGRATKEEYEEKRDQFGKTRMSLNTEGKPNRTSLDVWLESREALPEGAVWPAATRLSQARAVPPPKDLVEGDEMTKEKAKSINDDLAKQMPGMFNRPTAAATAS